METKIDCKYCGYSTQYKPLGANFIIFCPDCKKVMFLECEYGYGPAVPCDYYYRNQIIGKVFKDNKNNYVLNSSLLSVNQDLKSSYLDALYEAANIIENLIE